jgi:hypothetical protein
VKVTFVLFDKEALDAFESVWNGMKEKGAAAP